MAIRVSAMGLSFFYDGGIEVGINWAPLPDKLTADQRSVLIGRVGTVIQIHPEDVGNLAEHGLALVDGKIVEASLPPKKIKSGNAAKD